MRDWPTNFCRRCGTSSTQINRLGVCLACVMARRAEKLLRRLNAKSTVPRQAGEAASGRGSYRLSAGQPALRRQTVAAWKAKRAAKRLRRGDRRKRTGTYQKTSALVLAALCAEKEVCGVCGRAIKSRSSAIHHIVPKRLIPDGRPGDIALNLMALCQKCHNTYTTQGEPLVFRCDFVSAQLWWKGHDWPLGRVREAFRHFGYELRLLG